MKIAEIKKFPTSLVYREMQRLIDGGSTGAHESLLRSYHIVCKVKELLEMGTPQPVILELIEEIES